MRHFNIIKFIAVLVLMIASVAQAKPPVMTLALLSAPEVELNGWRVVGAERALEWCRRLEQSGRRFSKPYPLTTRPVLLTLVNADFLKEVPVEYDRNGKWKVYKYEIIAEHNTLNFYLVKRVMPDYEIPDVKKLNKVRARAKYEHGMSLINDPRSTYVEWMEAYCHLGSAADAGHIKAAYQTALLLRNRLKIEPENVVKYLRMAAERGYADAQHEYRMMFGVGDPMPESPLEGNVLRGALMADIFRVAPGRTREEAERIIDDMMTGVQPMDVEEQAVPVAMVVEVHGQEPEAMDVEEAQVDPVEAVVSTIVKQVRFMPQRGCN